MEKRYQEPRRQRPTLRIIGREPSEGGEETELRPVASTDRVLGLATLIGREVTNTEGRSLGHLKDIMVDAADSRVSFLILNPDIGLGLGNRLVVVPWLELHVEPDLRRLVLDLSHERLRDAPAFDIDHVPDMADREWVTAVYDYYGYQTDWVI